MKKLIYILLALPLLAAKCEKDQPTVAVINTPTPTDSTATDSTITELDKLPPITSTGANTFGCLLNGKAWLPTSGGTTNPKLVVDYFNNTFVLRASIFNGVLENNTTLRSSHQIFVDKLSVEGIYTNSNDVCKLNYLNIKSSCQYQDDNILSGEVVISKLDTIKRIISGQFDFTLYIDQTCDTVKITDGRFDVKY